MIELIEFKAEEYPLLCFSFQESPFGKVLLVSGEIGLCYLAFIENEAMALKDLESKFFGVTLVQKQEAIHLQAMSFFDKEKTEHTAIKLHVKGTEFQLKVWNELIKIPFGKTITYNYISKKLKLNNAARAVGTAVGANPIAYIIPCHRVIQTSGKLGGYRWGLHRKALILDHESNKSMRLF